jgi:hypothetical protein
MTDSELFTQAALAVAPTITERTMINIRHVNERNYILSTAQDATEEAKALYTPEMIARIEQVAARDNALTIAYWAGEITDAIRAVQAKKHVVWQHEDAVTKLKDKLRSFQDQLVHVQQNTSYPTVTPEKRKSIASSMQDSIQSLEKELLDREEVLRDLRRSAPFSGYSSPKGEGPVALGSQMVDSDLSRLPPLDPRSSG